ncbi:hypothetical protein [Amycolatopsis decaplanina]|uniref:hypothetical protein n=1 Tax=Amycolatopsis decaplanina TaxID=208441 RepID=UPI000349E800|nr:hypothetical protein [Amycolatopsis decaplanina]
MFPFDQLGTAAKALLHEANEAGTAIVDTVRDGVEWARDVLSGNVGTQAQLMPIPEVVQQMAQGSPDSWNANATTARAVADRHAEISNNLVSMLNNLEPAWTGRAAEAARGNTRQFTEVMDSAREVFTDNSGNVSDSAGSFVRAKHSFEPMGAPPDKGFYDVVTPWTTDTEAAIDAYNKAGRHNIAVYDDYAAQLDGQGSSLRVDYGIFPYRHAGAFSSDDSTPVRGFGARSESGEDHPVHSNGNPDMPTAGGAPAPEVVAGPGGHIDSAPVTGPGSANTPAAGRVRLGGDEITAASYHSLDPRATVPPPNAAAPGVSGPSGSNGPTAGGVNLVGGAGGLGSAGRIGGAGKVGNVGGAAGAGRHSGARGLAEESGRGGAGTGRGAGSRLTSGPAGMAPVAGRGAKDEDRERTRKYVQDESLFPRADTNDVDPTTGLPPVPPTIGA